MPCFAKYHLLSSANLLLSNFIRKLQVLVLWERAKVLSTPGLNVYNTIIYSPQWSFFCTTKGLKHFRLASWGTWSGSLLWEQLKASFRKFCSFPAIKSSNSVDGKGKFPAAMQGWGSWEHYKMQRLTNCPIRRHKDLVRTKLSEVNFQEIEKKRKTYTVQGKINIRTVPLNISTGHLFMIIKA